MTIYPQAFYSGQGSYSNLPTSPVGNATIPFTASSFALSGNVWAAVSAGSNSRVVLWNSVPDVSQLPASASGSLSLLNLQSSSCSPACSGNGICSSSGTCQCQSGFTGSSCESCSSGFFGPECKACPSGCTSCDDGISGTGRCLVPVVSNLPSSCNCINGECGSNGQCTCLAGWTSASNGTQCAACAAGFFLDTNGNCESESRYHFLPPQSHFWFKFVNWVVNNVPMAPETALLAHRVSLRTGTTVQSAMPFRKLRQMARLVPMEATALGLLARFVRRFARLVPGRIRTIVSFADLALTNLMGHA
jgi:hypothetical protein